MSIAPYRIDITFKDSKNVCALTKVKDAIVEEGFLIAVVLNGGKKEAHHFALSTVASYHLYEV